MSSRIFNRGVGLSMVAVGFWIVLTATTNELRIVGVALGILGGILFI